MRTKTYRMSFDSPIFFPLFIILIPTVLLWSEMSSHGRLWMLGLFLIFGLLASLVVRARLVVVSDQGLKAPGLLDTVDLRWGEVTEFQPRFGGGFRLRNHDHSKTLHVSAQLKDFESLVWQIWREAPQALETSKREFHVSLWAYAVVFPVSVSMVLFGFDALMQMDIGYTPFLILFGGFMLVLQLLLPKHITLMQDQIQLNSWVSKKVYSKAEVKSVELRSRHERWGNKLTVAIVLHSKKQIVISDIREGTPLFFAAMDNWLKS